MLLLVTSNDYKSAEYERLCTDAGLPLERWDGEIQEIQEIQAVKTVEAVEIGQKWDNARRPGVGDARRHGLGSGAALPA